jgi:hypothetical protein
MTNVELKVREPEIIGYWENPTEYCARFGSGLEAYSDRGSWYFSLDHARIPEPEHLRKLRLAVRRFRFRAREPLTLVEMTENQEVRVLGSEEEIKGQPQPECAAPDYLVLRLDNSHWARMAARLYSRSFEKTRPAEHADLHRRCDHWDVQAGFGRKFDSTL